MVPIVAENGSLYTFVIEKEHVAVVGKCPTTLVEESKLFYNNPPTGHYIQRKWSSIGTVEEKPIQANFQFTKKYI